MTTPTSADPMPTDPMPDGVRRWIRLAPIVVVQSYLWFTVILFAWGPWEWQIDNPTTLYGFLTLAHLALLVGYLAGVRHPGCRYGGQLSLITLLKLGIATTIIVFIPTSYSRNGTLLPDIMEGLRNPGAAYDNVHILIGDVPYVEYLRFFLGPFLVLPVPLGLFYWRNTGLLVRIGVIAAACSVITTFIAMGTYKGIGDTMLLFPWLIMASIASRKSKITRRAAIRTIVGVSLASILFFNYFSLGMSTRGGGSSPSANGVLSHVGVRADLDHPWLRGLPQDSKVGVLGVVIYLTAGYQALSMCLDEPWVPTYGVGNSFFLTRQAERFSGTADLWRKSYPARIEYRGWDSVGLWSSIYPWLASDLSFPGAIAAVFFIGWLFGKTWRDVLVGANPFAVVLFSQLVLVLFYFPANNQLLQSGEGFSSFFVTLIAWRLTRQRSSQ